MEVIRPLTTQELLFPVLEKACLNSNQSTISQSTFPNYDLEVPLDHKISFATPMKQRLPSGIAFSNFIRKNRLPILVGGIILTAVVLISIDYSFRRREEKGM
jgi:hypothetical protein